MLNLTQFVPTHPQLNWSRILDVPCISCGAEINEECRLSYVEPIPDSDLQQVCLVTCTARIECAAQYYKVPHIGEPKRNLEYN